MIRLPSGQTAGAAAVLLVLLAASWLAGETLAGGWVVRGESMLPTLLPGDRLVVDLWTLRHRAPRVGEIVLVRRPGSEAVLVKRVVRTLAGGAVWVEGDHRASSDDSRAFGAVGPERLGGRVVWRYWPPSRMGAPEPATEPRR